MNAQTQPIPRTVAEFAQACAPLSNDAIFELFENTISQELRDEIYDTYAGTDPETPEPCRKAMEAIGHKYNIKSLINY